MSASTISPVTEIDPDQEVCQRYMDGWLAAGALTEDLVVDGITFAEYQDAAQRLVDRAR